MPGQFARTEDERRSSFVFSSSVGKSGLYLPSDYIPSTAIPQITDERSTSTESQASERQWADEYDSLLNTSNSHTLQEEAGLLHISPERGYDSVVSRSRRTSLPKSLVEQERELLIDNKLLSMSTDGNHTLIDNDQNGYSSMDVQRSWECAIATGKDITTSYKREAKVITQNALPLIVTFILQNSLSLASIFSVSHLGTKELGGVTLGSMTANITGLAAIQGLCTCLDTLCAQAYGARNYHLVGVLVQRCAVITMLAFLPMIYLWFFWSETILSNIIPERELCHLAANYLKVTAFGVPGFIIFECGKRFLQCQGIFHASTIVLFICAPLNALMNYLLVWNRTLSIGYLGAPLSVTINYWLMAGGLVLYTITTNDEHKPLKCWSHIIRWHQIFKNWKKMFGLALPGMIMVEAEFLGFEILTIFASHLGETALAAQSIVSTVASLAYQVPFSISISTSTRVANFIGASLPEACLKTCKVSLLLSFVCSSVNMLIIFKFRTEIAGMFSTETDVVMLVAATLPQLAFMQIFDAFNASTAGCLRGQGRQKIGGYINIFAFYCIGVPMAHLLTFRLHMGVSGLWFGITCALATMSICQGYAVFHVDWQAVTRAAKLRNREGSSRRSISST